MFLTEAPCGEIPAGYKRAAAGLTDRYIRRNIILNELADESVRTAIYNRYLHLMLDGCIPPTELSLDLHITPEMEAALYEAFRTGEKNADVLLVAFLSYHVAKFLRAKFHPLPEEPLLSELTMSLYTRLFDVLRNEWQKERMISTAYLEYSFLDEMRKVLWQNSTMQLSVRRYKLSYMLRRIFGDAFDELSVEDIIDGYNALGLCTKISRNDIDAIRMQRAAFGDLCAWGTLNHSVCCDLQYYFDSYEDLLEYEIERRTFEMARKMDSSLDERTMLAIVHSLQDFFEDKKGKGFKTEALRRLAADISVVPVTFEMVMYCYATSVKEVRLGL